MQLQGVCAGWRRQGVNVMAEAHAPRLRPPSLPIRSSEPRTPAAPSYPRLVVLLSLGARLSVVASLGLCSTSRHPTSGLGSQTERALYCTRQHLNHQVTATRAGHGGPWWLCPQTGLPASRLPPALQPRDAACGRVARHRPPRPRAGPGDGARVALQGAGKGHFPSSERVPSLLQRASWV